MIKPFPRLNNYPANATQEELLKYLAELLDWCDSTEHIFMGMGLTEKRCNVNLNCSDCGEKVWCFSDETLEIIEALNKSKPTEAKP